MPQVPIYEPRVREQALDGGFQRTPDVSSGALRAGQGLATIGVALNYAAERDATAKASEVEAAITSEWLKWDASPEGRAKYRGQNADGYAPAAEAWWENARKTYGQGLDPRAQAIASKSLTAKKTAALGAVGTFTMAEKERHADETYAADINTTIQFGITSGDVASTAQQVREKAAALGARKGWTTEQVQAEAGKNLSMMHLAQITKLAEVDATKAQEYYDANKAEVGFAQQARIEQVLKGEMDNQFATQKAAEWAGRPLSEQLAEAAKITDPQRREKTLTQVRNNYALVKQAEQERENAAADQAWQLIAQGKRVPEIVLTQMSGRERVQLQEHLRVRSERVAKGATVKTDPAKLAGVYDMMRDDPEGFKKLRMGSLTEYVSPSDMEQIARIQRDMLKPEKESGAITAVQAIEAYAEGLGKQDKLQFKRRAFDELDKFQLDKGRAPTTAERRQLLDSLTTEVVLHKGLLWDTTGPAFKQEKPKPTQPQALPRVTTVEQARALPKGTRFIDPQGVERIR